MKLRFQLGKFGDQSFCQSRIPISQTSVMSLIIVLKDICMISNFFRKILKWKKSLNSHLSISIKPAENSFEFVWSNHSWKAHTIVMGLFFSKIIINVNRTFIRKIWVKTYHASYRSLRSVIICQNFLVGHMVCWLYLR